MTAKKNHLKKRNPTPPIGILVENSWQTRVAKSQLTTFTGLETDSSCDNKDNNGNISDDEGTNGYALANLFENNDFLLLNGMHGLSAGNDFDANERFRYYMNGASISPRLIKQLSLFT